MKKILVTGATGFIGNYVIKELLENNCKVFATSSNEPKARKSPWFSQVVFIPFNLRDFKETVNYFALFNEPDLVIHLAWEGLPNYKAAFHVEENLPRHLSFLKNLVNNGLADLTVTGTCFEYGMQEGCLKEDMDTFPSNAYAVAKDSLRKTLQLVQQGTGLHLKWLRLFYMYGKGQSPNSLFSLLDQALANGDEAFNMSGGEQVRDYLPVEKMAEYIVKAALQNEITGIINCCSGVPVTLKKLVEDYLIERNKTIELNTGYFPYSDYEPMRFWGDNTKLIALLGNK